ncbi:type I signal peptidase [Salsuginibacillus halophilus]|uniref:Signal peptidase I n=1 Tax=Salsuginibacillus halophilus TaxID=517424 RepID=A0A2P8HG56_9BACI|nr:type I signal peptidase [Salsuginibacillus halophilus]
MNSIGREVWEWAKTFAVVLVIVLLVRMFLFANYVVHGESMMPTIEDGERLIINKVGYEIADPERFDLVVFNATDDSDYIKRIIGLPGDELRFEDDELYINGESYDEPYLDEAKGTYSAGPFTYDFSLLEVTGEAVVPEDQLFVLGDNRRNSLDSRQLGYIAIDDVVGKANIRYWPVDDISMIP